MTSVSSPTNNLSKKFRRVFVLDYLGGADLNWGSWHISNVKAVWLQSYKITGLTGAAGAYSSGLCLKVKGANSSDFNEYVMGMVLFFGPHSVADQEMYERLPGPGRLLAGNVQTAAINIQSITSSTLHTLNGTNVAFDKIFLNICVELNDDVPISTYQSGTLNLAHWTTPPSTYFD